MPPAPTDSLPPPHDRTAPHPIEAMEELDADTAQVLPVAVPQPALGALGEVWLARADPARAMQALREAGAHAAELLGLVAQGRWKELCDARAGDGTMAGLLEAAHLAEDRLGDVEAARTHVCAA